jgi:O-acetyl-ADP-ribose deacetylase (regulator of RNase III)
MQAQIEYGDLIGQRVDVIVNSWNRNIIPWWLFLPQGVSGAIKKHAGIRPFQELAKAGPIPLGGAVLTSSGRLPCKGIIHVAGISMWWTASAHSIQDSVRSAMAIVNREGFASVAFPLIGGGVGSFDEDKVLQLMQEALAPIKSPARVVIVRFQRR